MSSLWGLLHLPNSKDLALLSSISTSLWHRIVPESVTIGLKEAGTHSSWLKYTWIYQQGHGCFIDVENQKHSWPQGGLRSGTGISPLFLKTQWSLVPFSFLTHAASLSCSRNMNQTWPAQPCLASCHFYKISHPNSQGNWTDSSWGLFSYECTAHRVLYIPNDQALAWETTAWEGDKEQVKNDQPCGLWSATWAAATIFHAIVLYLPVIPQGSGHAPASVFTFAVPFA